LKSTEKKKTSPGTDAGNTGLNVGKKRPKVKTRNPSREGGSPARLDGSVEGEKIRYDKNGSPVRGWIQPSSLLKGNSTSLTVAQRQKSTGRKDILTTETLGFKRRKTARKRTHSAAVMPKKTEYTPM